jgi:hypothetical protein
MNPEGAIVTKKLYHIVLMCLGLCLSGCHKKSASGNPRLPILTLAGTAEVPAPFAVYDVFNSAQAFAAITRFSCPAQGNGSLIQGPTVVLHTVKNCSDQQWLYFYLSDPADLSAYAAGTIELRLQATGGDMSISAKIQDDATKVSKEVDLAAYGFDKSKGGVEQKVAIPVSHLTGDGLDLSKLKRLLHLDVNCASSNCYLSLFSVKWLGPTEPEAAKTALRDQRHCDPFACHALKQATYRIYRASSQGWTATPVGGGITLDDGSYRLLLNRSELETLMNEGKPLMLAMAERGGVFTFSALITADILDVDQFVLDTTLSSTLASQLVCPGGRSPAAAGSYCYAPARSALVSLQDALTAYLAAQPVSTTDFAAIAGAAAANPAIEQALKSIMTDPNLMPTSQIIQEKIASSPLPPPTDGPASSSSLPTDLPAGNYLFSFRVCGAGICQDGSQQVTAASGDVTNISNQIAAVFKQTSLDCAAAGVTCQDRYSRFNGTSFTASRFMQSCSGDICATASVFIKMTLQ